MILSETPHYFDLLTNFALKPEVFAKNLNGQQRKLQRDAPTFNLFSYHAEEMNRVWHEKVSHELVNRCEALRDLAFAYPRSRPRVMSASTW